MRAALVALLALAALSMPTAAHADAARGEATACATFHEFNQIGYGDSRAHVQELLDGPGRHAAVRVNRGIIQREWRLCGRRLDRGRLIVRYSHASDRVRMALWLEVSRGTLA